MKKFRFTDTWLYAFILVGCAYFVAHYLIYLINKI